MFFESQNLQFVDDVFVENILIDLELIPPKPSGKDLVGYDWVYPDMNNLMAAWKFSGDGTFNVSQKAFGGSTRRGQWKDLGNGQVELIYDDGGFVRSGDGGSANVDARATITLLSKS